MKVFYLNCARRLKLNRDKQNWLLDFVKSNDIDVICLAESSNYDFGNLLPDIFPDDEKHRWNAPQSVLAKGGWKFNICSKIPAVFKSINYDVPDILIGSDDIELLTDYCTNTMISMTFANKVEILPVHIQHKKGNPKSRTKSNAYYEDSLLTLRNYMLSDSPIVVFGDFNNFPEDKSFLDLTDNTGYKKANTEDVEYTYKNNEATPGFVIDHTFTTCDNVKMKYINAIKHGFDHKGMLITIP